MHHLLFRCSDYAIIYVFTVLSPSLSLSKSQLKQHFTHAFFVKSESRSFIQLCFVIFATTILYERRTRKMLMKLTPKQRFFVYFLSFCRKFVVEALPLKLLFVLQTEPLLFSFQIGSYCSHHKVIRLAIGLVWSWLLFFFSDTYCRFFSSRFTTKDSC